MAEQFYTILTTIGKAKIANATALGIKINLTEFKVGDGGGSYYNPTESQQELKNTVWKGNISSVTIDEENPNWIVLQTIIPANIGGFMVREGGIFDNEGNLIAVGKYPETYKPVASEGSSKDVIIKMILEVSNASSVTLKVDPSVIVATKKDVEILEQKIKNIKVPVESVNSKTGAIELKAEDINCNDGKSVESHLEENKKQIDQKLPQIDFDNFRKDYVSNNGFAKTTGTSTIYNVILNPAPTSYVDGLNVTIIPHIDCGDNPKLNINGLGVTTILKQDGTDIKAGEIKANKPLSLVRVGSNFFIKNSGGSGLQIKRRTSGFFSATPENRTITLPYTVNVDNAIILTSSDFSELEYYFDTSLGPHESNAIKLNTGVSSAGLYWEVIEFNKKVHNLKYEIRFKPNEVRPTQKYNIDVKDINKVLMFYNRNATPTASSALQYHNDIGIELGNDTSGNFIKLHFKSTYNNYYSANIRIFLIEFD